MGHFVVIQLLKQFVRRQLKLPVGKVGRVGRVRRVRRVRGSKSSKC